MERYAFELDSRERVGTKLIVYDAPMHDRGQGGRPLSEWVNAIRVLNPDLVLVDCGGIGKSILDALKAAGVNAAALPKVAR